MPSDIFFFFFLNPGKRLLCCWILTDRGKWEEKNGFSIGSLVVPSKTYFFVTLEIDCIWSCGDVRKVSSLLNIQIVASSVSSRSMLSIKWLLPSITVTTAMMICGWLPTTAAQSNGKQCYSKWAAVMLICVVKPIQHICMNQAEGPTHRAVSRLLYIIRVVSESVSESVSVWDEDRESPLSPLLSYL